MTDEQFNERFMNLLTTHQSQLTGFILSLLGNYLDSQEVLQRTNLTLWKKSDDFRRDAPFLPWSFGIARYEVLRFLSERNRERTVFHSDVVALMADAAESEFEQWPEREEALHKCLEKLSDEHRRIFWLRYAEGKSVTETAEAVQKSMESIKSLMLRVRRSLRDCIERNLAEST